MTHIPTHVRNRRMNGRPPAAMVLVGALLLSACGSDGDDVASTGTIDKLTWGVNATIRSLDYTQSADAVSAAVISVGCETLVQYDQLGRLQPNLAASFETPDPMTYVYTIRDDVTFWNGNPLTPEDVVYSLEKAASTTNGSQISSFYANVESITADGSDVTIKLKNPDPYFRYSPAVTYIVEKAFAEESGTAFGSPGTLTMCTGPYEFTSFTPDDRVEAVRHEEYWGEAGVAEELELRFIVSNATRLLAMRSGEIDGTFQVPQDQLEQWQDLEAVEVETAPELRTAYISFDLSTAPWDDVHVRRAVAHALDREGLVEAILRGNGEAAPVLPPREQWGDVLTQDEVDELYPSFTTYEFDLDMAREELAQSEYPDGFTAPITYSDSDPNLGKVALALAENLKDLGINLEVQELTSDAWLAVIYGEKQGIGAQMVGWGVDYPDPADALHFIADSQWATANAFNTANYKNPEMDRLLREQENTTDPAVRAAAITDALELIAVEVPYLPIWYQDMAMAIKDEYQFPDFGTWYLYTPWAAKITTR